MFDWLRVTIDALFYPVQLIIIMLIRLYQKVISPMLPRCCGFYPTCSNYMILAIKEWGICKGVYLGIRRLLRCRPNSKGGEDFVPLNIKGGLKWIY